MNASLNLKKAEKTPLSGMRSRSLLGLPYKFLGDASKRLGWVSLIYAFTFAFAYFVSQLPEWIRERTVAAELVRPNAIVAYVSILTSFFIFALSRSCRISAQRVLDIGLIYLVLGSFGISMAEFWGAFNEWSVDFVQNQFLGIPWECVWILIFPILAPNTHLKTFVGALGAASTGPLALYLSMTFGATTSDIPLGFFVRYFLFTTYLCAFLALVISHVIHGFGVHLRKAEEIGSYRLTDLLGKGGMGEVWKGRHRMLARPAAIKLIRPEVLGIDETKREEAVARFGREAQATAALQSYHTINLYDFGVSDEGSFYYVMELLDGLNLDVFVKRFGPVSAERTIFMLRQVCHSLGEAHEKQLIHRDIKPANIYVCRQGQDYDFVKVLDFGLVKSSKSEQKEATQLTLQGVVTGTPGFMAPEMALGKGTVDGRSDIYSLGCVAYWLTTGQLVFEGDTPLEKVVHHIQSAPVPPSEKSEMNIPKPLEEIILACLEKNPDARPQSILELDQLLANCNIERRWDNEKAREWWALHRPA